MAESELEEGVDSYAALQRMMTRVLPDPACQWCEGSGVEYLPIAPGRLTAQLEWETGDPGPFYGRVYCRCTTPTESEQP